MYCIDSGSSNSSGSGINSTYSCSGVVSVVVVVGGGGNKLPS